MLIPIPFALRSIGMVFLPPGIQPQDNFIEILEKSRPSHIRFYYSLPDPVSCSGSGEIHLFLALGVLGDHSFDRRLFQEQKDPDRPEYRHWFIGLPCFGYVIYSGRFLVNRIFDGIKRCTHFFKPSGVVPSLCPVYRTARQILIYCFHHFLCSLGGPGGLYG